MVLTDEGDDFGQLSPIPGCNISVIDSNRAGMLEKAADRTKQRGLAAPVRAYHPNPLAAVHFQIDLPQNGRLLTGKADGEIVYR